MAYTYEGRLEQVEGDWLVTFPQFDGAFGGGRSIGKACENAAEHRGHDRRRRAASVPLLL